MKIYLAGPMRGIKDFNFPAFMEAAEKLRQQGHTVFNPAEKDIEKHGPEAFLSPTGSLADPQQVGFDLRDALANDLWWICKNAEAVALLPGWENSHGAMAEFNTAKALSLKTITL